jgi:hypothetical protein
MTALHKCEARAGLDLRLLRAAVFTAVCVALSAAGHGLASAAAIPLWTLAAGFLGLLAVAVPLAGRPRSLAGITAVLAVGQIALHTLFGIGQQDMAMPHSAAETALMTHAARLMYGADAAAAGHGYAGPMSTGPAGGPGMGAMPGLPGGTGMLTSTGGAPAPPMDSSLPVLHALSMLPSLPMLLVHVLAAVAAGWLLRRGDLAVFRLVALSAQGVAEATLVRALRAALALVRALRAGLFGTRLPGPRASRTPATAPPLPQTAPLQHTVIRRGPPPGAVCVLGA